MTDFHTFVLNAIGEERRQKVLFPLIKSSIEKHESFFVTNSDGKLIDYLSSDLKKHDYRVFYLDFSDTESDWHWNPLQYPYQLYKSGKIDSSFEQVSILASTIMGRESRFSKQDPFWVNSASGLFESLAMALFKIAANPQEVNLLSILDMVIEGSTNRSVTNTYLREFFMLEQCKEFYKNAATYLNAPSDTRGGISSTFIQGLSNTVGNKLFSRHLLTDTLNLHRIPQKKTAIIVNLSDSASNTTLSGLLISQIYYALLKNNKTINNYNAPFTFYLDRFLNLGPIPKIEKFLSFSLDCQIRFVLFVDNIAMLESTYDDVIGKAIREYCARWIIYPTRNQTMLAEINNVLDTYDKNQKQKLLNELRDNRPLLFDEQQKVLPYSNSKEDVFSFRPIKKKQNVFLPQEPNIFSIIDYANESKKQIVLDKMQIGDIRNSETVNLGETNMAFEAKNTPPFDLDDYIRRLDEKIKELEEEEKRELEEEEKRESERVT